ncbi:hypothetical protein [Methanosarcina mazei]|jgi:hypothetical protein|uniref:Uncharacterized protein n=1 Tax=Methanosarcina mazei TaxID=2209 RepID=A0A0F8DXY3_METMZ|nr:hypothetical protein [Methanosarcina mazei]KKG33302.1 hypothetical protein DU30_09220 [Methanosarcina mazei]
MVKKCLINDDLIKICADNVRLGLSYAACSKAIHVSYQTWRNWEKWGQEGKVPYAKWYIAIQAAEADLMKECLESVKLSMRLGDVKSAMFLLQTRFSNEGFGKQVNLKAQVESQNMNLNLNVGSKDEEKRAAIMKVLDKLAPKNNMLVSGPEE